MHSFVPFQNTFHHVDMVLPPWMLIIPLDSAGYSDGDNTLDERDWRAVQRHTFGVWFMPSQLWKVIQNKRPQATIRFFTLCYDSLHKSRISVKLFMKINLWIKANHNMMIHNP